MEAQIEDDAPAKPSVAELAGKFKAHAHPAPTGTEKPVRRRPPRTLQLPIKTQEPGEGEEKPTSTSPHPAKTKRNSSLIEKLQANLALSPSALPLSPKSPGLRLLPLSFTPPSPCSPKTPTSPLSLAAPPTRQQSEEETPATFETPASSSDGSVLPSINKSRARVSIKRRPPSRRHRKSSSGAEVVGATGEDTPLSTPDGPEAKGDEAFGEKEKNEAEERDGEEVASAAASAQTESETPPSDALRRAAAAEGGEERGEEEAQRRESGGEKEEVVEEKVVDGVQTSSEVHEDSDRTTQTSSAPRETGEGDEVPSCEREKETVPNEEEGENKTDG